MVTLAHNPSLVLERFQKLKEEEENKEPEDREEKMDIAEVLNLYSVGDTDILWYIID